MSDACDIAPTDSIFANLKAQHLCWKERLLSYLDGNNQLIGEKEITSCKDCNLGQWIYPIGLVQYQDIPEVKELEQVHQQMHKLAEDTVWFNNKHDRARREKVWHDLGAASKKIIKLLDILSTKIQQ